MVKTDNRREGIKTSLKALGANPVKNKDVLIKPNFNTADVFSGSTHNDTLVALVEELCKLGSKSIILGERSYPPTRQEMEQKGIMHLMKDLHVKTIDSDTLSEKDWVLIKAEASHWEKGFRIARPVLESESLVSTCCLKTHQYGGVFTMSLKLHVGCVSTTSVQRLEVVIQEILVENQDAKLEVLNCKKFAPITLPKILPCMRHAFHVSISCRWASWEAHPL